MAPKKPNGKINGTHFKSMARADVPHGRNGKHKAIVTQILSDLDSLKKGDALQIPLDDLAETKERVRSALNRATRNRAGATVVTASDEKFLYVWTDN